MKCSAVFRKNRSNERSSGCCGTVLGSAGLVSCKNASVAAGYVDKISSAARLTNVYCEKVEEPCLAEMKYR